MSNDYFKAQGWFKNYARNSQDSRGMFQRLVKEDEEAFRLASAETDRIKDMINEKFGPGTMKPASELPPIQNPFKDFEERNPAAEGGQMVKPSADGSRPGYAGDRDKTTKIKNFIGKKKKIKKTEIIKLLNDLEYPNWSTQLVKLKQRGYFDNVEIIDDFKRTANTLEGGGSRISQVEDIFKNWKSIGKKNYTKQELIDALPEGAYEKNKAAYNTAENKIKKNYKSIKLIEQNIERSKPLPKSVQQKLIEAFPEIDFKFGTKAQPGYGIRKYGVSKKEVGDALYDELTTFAKYNLKPEFPKGTTPESKLLYSMFRSTQPESGGGIKFQLVDKNGKVIPKEKYPNNWRKDEAYKNIRILDTETGDIIKYTDDIKGKGISMKEYINKVEKNSKAYDQALESYKLQKNISTTPYTYKGKEYTLGGTLNKNRVIENFKKEFKRLPTKDEMKDLFRSNKVGSWQVHHPEGVANNWWKSEVAFRDANMKLNYLDKNLKASLKTIDNPKDKAKLIKQVSTEVKKLPGGISYIFEGQELGKPLNLKSVIQAPILQANLKTGEKKAIEKAIQEIDYIGGQGGTTLSSGFNTDLLMKDPAVQKLLNSKAGQAVKNAARGTAGAVGKAFGVADILIGVLDYENNISKGQKPDEALGNAVQAMSFGLYKSGDRARIADVKERFVAKGGDGEIFDQATALNEKDQEINDLIYKSKFKADKAFMDLSQPQAILGKSLDQRKQDYEIYKKSLNEKIRDAIEERDNMIKSYKTNLQVSEAGAPIQIGGQEFFSQPFKDIRAATMDKIREENRKAYDMQKRQVNFTSGNIGNWLQNNIFTMSPLERAELQKQINNMDERELYKFNLERGMDPDNLIRFEDILRYKTNDPALMGVNTTQYINKRDRKSEGGITSLRSKYEYKK